jgi:hypothetical protein
VGCFRIIAARSNLPMLCRCAMLSSMRVLLSTGFDGCATPYRCLSASNSVSLRVRRHPLALRKGIVASTNTLSSHTSRPTRGVRVRSRTC